jgi:CHAD domain-containing protein
MNMAQSRLLDAGQRDQIDNIITQNASGTLYRRARVILLYDEGLATHQVADTVGISGSGCRYWRGRFAKEGMAIFGESFSKSTRINDSDAHDLPQAEILVDEQTSADILEPQLETLPEQSSDLLEPEEISLNEFASRYKKIKKTGTEAADSLAEAGRKVLRFHFARMLQHEDGTRRGEDIEELHDMRVATRRMRSAFEVFGEAYKPKVIKPHLKGLRATGRALGRVRDLDVFMEKAQHYIDEQVIEQDDGLQPLLQSWQHEREQARAEMIAYLDSDAYAWFKGAFYDFLVAPGAGVKQPPATDFHPRQVRDIAPVLIYTRLGRVRAFDAVLDSASLDQLHALRIEFKKLRYTTEYFEEVLGPEANLVIKDIKKVQDHLGDLNDAQVATEILRAFLTQWDDEQAQLSVVERHSPEPIMDYLSYRYTERHRLMLTFKDTWGHFSRPEFRQNLAAAISVL